MKKRLISLLLLAAIFAMLVIPVQATGLTLLDDAAHPDRVVDQAGLLYDDEADALREKLDRISTDLDCDVVVVTVDSLTGKTATEYADDYFDYNGYGMEDGTAGILLLVAMDERKWAMSTKGFGIEAFTDFGLSYMEDRFRPYLSDGDYAGAFNVFADLSESLLNMARNGEPYDVVSTTEPVQKQRGPLSAGLTIFCLVLGCLLACIPMAIFKHQIKNVAEKHEASDYLRQSSLHLTRSNDIYLYRNVSRTRRQTESRSGGGSSTHFSSSGSSHGGSSGSF